MPALELPATFDRIVSRLTRGEPVDPDDLAELAAAMHANGISFNGGSVPPVVASLPAAVKAKLIDAQIRAGWDRAVARVNAQIAST
jgi:hypothetical protein